MGLQAVFYHFLMERLWPGHLYFCYKYHLVILFMYFCIWCSNILLAFYIFVHEGLLLCNGFLFVQCLFTWFYHQSNAGLMSWKLFPKVCIGSVLFFSLKWWNSPVKSSGLEFSLWECLYLQIPCSKICFV